MAVIQFEDYKVKKIFYEENENFSLNSDAEGVEIPTEFNIEFAISEDNTKARLEIALLINCQNDLPFSLEAVVEGYFKYTINEDDVKTKFEKLLKTNALAILYPYVRQVVSSVTNMSNNYPAYILPTINAAKLLDN